MSLDTSKIFKSGGEFYTVRWAVEGPSAGVGLYGGHNGIGLGGRDFAFAIADWHIDVFAADSVATIAVTNSGPGGWRPGSEEHTSELQSRGHLVCRLLLAKKQNSRKTK